jgi:calcineurin-like phosphoesterase family protein
MTTWFTSDTHFGHAAILRLAARPFESVAAMDAEMIRRWNAVVKPTDTVWHIGDFSHKSAASVADYCRQLHGKIHLVAGNHDRHIVAGQRDAFASIHDLVEIEISGHTLILCHYPMREWDKAWRGAWHLHGHVHGRFDTEPLGRSLDVGVDSRDYTPINVEQIEVAFRGRPNPFVDAATREARSKQQQSTKTTRKVTPMPDDESLS